MALVMLRMTALCSCVARTCPIRIAHVARYPRSPNPTGSIHRKRTCPMLRMDHVLLAERGGFEPPRRVTPTYRFSKPAPSATWVPLRDVA